MVQDEVPGSVGVRTDDGNEWRYDAIEKAADFYDCNRSNAIVFACSDVDAIVGAYVLELDDLTVEQRKEIVETLSTRTMTFEVNTEIAVDTD